MTLSNTVAVAMFTGVVLYALFGGADFGSGFWNLTAGGPHRGSRLRVLIDHSIGPVWEANHVWLIYILVFLWTAYPTVFAAIMTTLFIPLILALLGIVLRGANFAFRKYSATMGQARLFGVLFAVGQSHIRPRRRHCRRNVCIPGRGLPHRRRRSLRRQHAGRVPATAHDCRRSRHTGRDRTHSPPLTHSR